MIDALIKKNIFNLKDLTVGEKGEFLCSIGSDHQTVKVLAWVINNKILTPISFDSQPFKIRDLKYREGDIRVWKFVVLQNNNDISKIYINVDTANPKMAFKVINSHQPKLDVIASDLRRVGLSSGEFTEYFKNSENGIFIRSDSIGGNQPNAILLKQTDLCQDEDGIYKLKGGVYFLPGYKIPDDEIITIRESYTDILFYKNLKVEDSGNRIPTISIKVIRNFLISNYVKNIFANKNDVEKKSVKSFSKFIDDFNFSQACEDELLNRMGGTKEDILEYFQNVRDFLEPNTQSFKDQIALLIANNCSKVKDKILEEKYDELQILLDEINKELENNKTLNEKLVKENDELELSIKNKQQQRIELENFERDFTNSFCEKLEKLQARIPESLADFYFKPNYGITVSSNDVSSSNKCENTTLTLNEYEAESESECIENVDDLFGCGSANMGAAGIREDITKALMSVIFACQQNHFNIILCGPKADTIIEAYSRTLYAKTPTVLDCTLYSEKDAVGLINNCSSEIVLIRHPFSGSWLNTLAEIPSLTEKFIIISYPFAEDLVLQPKSFYSYYTPIFTEPLLAGTNQITTSSKNVSQDFFSAKTTDMFWEDLDKIKFESNTWYPLPRLSSWVKSRYEQLFIYVKCLGESNYEISLYLILLMPYLCATDSKDELLSLCENLSKDVKDIIFSFAGIDDE